MKKNTRNLQVHGLWTKEDNWRVDVIDPVVKYRQETIYFGRCMQALSIVVAFMELCFFNALWFFDPFGNPWTSDEELE